MSRLIVVSNRVNVPDDQKKATAGGLAVALTAALRKYNGIWFGWSGEISEHEGKGVNLAKKSGVTYATIDLVPEDHEKYYNGFANRTLWPLFHMRTDLARYDREFVQTYYRVNRLFAEAITPLVTDDDLVWIHDYHLINLGQELRRQGLKNRMGFFLHIPWPALAILLTLPNHESLVSSMFAYDVIGFQTKADLRAFRDYVRYEAGGEILEDGYIQAYGRTIRARAFPIGLDTESVVRMTQTAESRRHFERMVKSNKERALVIGADRLDYTKGVLERMHAFERLLALYPDLHGKVSLLQIAPPSRTDVPEYNEIREQLEWASGRINGQYAEYDWMPIKYLNKGFSRTALTGLYRASRIGLVTPLRDGMNLVAKEYVAAQDPEDPGVLVLSRFAGASWELGCGAIICNPYDEQGVAEAIHEGLHLPLDERKQRHAEMMEVLRTNSVEAWRDRFVEHLKGGSG